MFLDSPDLEARASLWIRRLTIGFVVLAIGLGAAQAWATRFSMNNDGLQYLDNATLYFAGDFRHAINSQWSPLYPWLIGALFAVVHPGPYREFQLVHLLNLILYLASLGSFLFFMASLRRMLALPEIRVLGLLAISYSAFLYCSLDFTSLTYVTPDLLVSFFAFLAAGYLLRIAAGFATVLQYLGLGLVLGFGYLAKAPFFLFGLLCLGIVCVLARRSLPVLITAAAFAMVCVPYISLLSSAKGRLTIGDSGRFNLIWMVNGVPLYHWQGGPPGNGQPAHPTRQLSTNPKIFEFATPVAGTYPPWYDPTYWDEGARVAFRPGDFARAVMTQIHLYSYWIHHRQLPLVFGALALLLLVPLVWSNWKPFWPVLLFAAMPFAMYALVHAEARYLAPFFVLLWTVMFAGLLGAAGKVDLRVMLSIVTVTALLMAVEALLGGSEEKRQVPPRLQYEIAQRLEASGLIRGDPVAVFTSDLAYDWARMARARIILQVTLAPQPCAACGDRQDAWEKAKPILAVNGAKFVVAPCIPGIVDQPGWQPLGATGVFAYRFN